MTSLTESFNMPNILHCTKTNQMREIFQWRLMLHPLVEAHGWPNSSYMNCIPKSKNDSLGKVLALVNKFSSIFSLFLKNYWWVSHKCFIFEFGVELIVSSKGGSIGSTPAYSRRGPSSNPAWGKLVETNFLKPKLYCCLLRSCTINII